MKRIPKLSILVALAVSGGVLAQSGDMKGMDMKQTRCMDMQDMNREKCIEMMKGMGSGDKAKGTSSDATVHKASAVVKSVDPAKGTVTLAHEPVQSLNWPAMTMAFSVKNKALFDKLAVGKKVDVEFTREGADYVVVAVK